MLAGCIVNEEEPFLVAWLIVAVQDELYLPILAKFLPNGNQVAAHRVYQVAGEQLLPWLGTGTST